MSILLFVSMLIHSCKKESLSPPSISLTSPTDGKQLQVPDSIHVIGQVDDPDGMESVLFQILKPNLVQTGEAQLVQLNGKTSYSFDLWLYLLDANSLSGEYSFKITVKDSQGATNVAYRKLNVSEWPLDRLGIMMVYPYGNSEVRAAYLDENSNFQTLAARTSDIGPSAINHRTGQLIIAGNKTGPCLGIDINTDQIEYTIPSENPFDQPYFTSIYTFEERTWLAFYDGRLRELRSSGTSAGEFIPDPDFHVEEMLYKDAKLFIEMKNQTPGSNRLRVLNPQTGAAFQDRLLNGDIVKIMNRSGDETYLLVNENGQAKLYIYSYQNNAKNTIRNLASGNAYAADRIDENRLLIVQDDGVYLFDYATTNYVLINALNDATLVAYDPVFSQYAVADGTHLKLYSFPSGSMLYSQNTAYTAENLMMWYSR